jgi:hypothetical protein
MRNRLLGLSNAPDQKRAEAEGLMSHPRSRLLYLDVRQPSSPHQQQ